ncbi:MAG: 50S ribosomal protein L29 [Planctomycetes bacterium]|nr:50S ribosomal protein L29 [Planctomycetota bacterium]
MKLSEIRGKDSRELRLDAQGLHKELFELRFRAASEEVAKTSRFREIRRAIARINTVLRERELAAIRGDGNN